MAHHINMNFNTSIFGDFMNHQFNFFLFSYIQREHRGIALKGPDRFFRTKAKGQIHP